MASYWRYSNRRTYDQMAKNNELWDWAAGQNLWEIGEGDGLESIAEEDEETLIDGSGSGGSIDMLSLKSWNNDFDFEYEARPPLPLVDRTSNSLDDGG